MSSALAIAGVSLLLQKLLSDGLSDSSLDVEMTSLLDCHPSISIGPPDRVVSDNHNDPSQLNLFLYQVSSNQGWRNQGLPSCDTFGHQRLSNPSLGIDLHYLISAYGAAELHAEILLGYAMQRLHDTPVLSRAAIRRTVTNSTDDKARAVLAAAKLEAQVEQLKITPEYLSNEEMSKIWTALQAHYRPTAAYQVSVVLIQANEPIRAPLPVLTRGRPAPSAQRDPGVQVSPGLVPPVPTLESIRPSRGQPTAALGETIELFGHDLNGTDHLVRLINDRLDVQRSLPVTVVTDADGRIERLDFDIPEDPVTEPDADFPVGVYRIDVQLWSSDGPKPRETNQLALTIAPSITELPAAPVITDSEQTATFGLKCTPAVRPGQSVLLILGQHAYPPSAFSTAVSELQFIIPDAPLGNHLARLRIDGIDSPIIDRVAEPPAFLDARIRIESS
jgi:hypothetical protein